MKKIKKKGDLPSGFVVIVVLLVIGFVILLYFLFKFLWTPTVNNEVCHQSVIIRGTAASVSLLAEDYVPLKCQTAKYCITTKLIGKGNCEEFKGESYSSVRVKNVEDIDQFISREILGCWKMMGEGRLSLFTQYLAKKYGVFGTVYPTCVFCSRIAFDKESLKGMDLSGINLLDYMSKHKPPESDLTYSKYFGESKAGISFNFQNAISGITVDNNGMITAVETKGAQLELTALSGEDIKKLEAKDIYDKELTVMFMQISAPGYWESAKNIFKDAGFTAAGTVLILPVFKIFKTVVGIVGKGGAITLGLLAAGAVYQVGSVAHNRAVTATYCGDVSAPGEARNGCSAVRTVNYDVNSISQYCSEIESMP